MQDDYNTRMVGHIKDICRTLAGLAESRPDYVKEQVRLLIWELPDIKVMDILLDEANYLWDMNAEVWNNRSAARRFCSLVHILGDIAGTK